MPRFMMDLTRASTAHGHSSVQSESNTLSLQEANELYQQAVNFEKGEEGEIDVQRAHDYYKRAAEAGHVEACYRYGVCLKHGKGTEKNPEVAFTWFVKAAEANYPPAQVSAWHHHSRMSLH